MHSAARHGDPHGFASRDVGRHVERSYRIELSRPPERMRSGPETAVWRVCTASADYFAKIFPADQRSMVETEVDLVRYLARVGVRTPHLMTVGRDYAIRFIGGGGLRWFWVSGCPVILMKREPMRSLSPQTVTRQEMTLIGRATAAMHLALSEYPGRRVVRAIDRLQQHSGSFDDLLRSPNAAPFDDDRLARWRALDERMRALAATPWAVSLTESVLHGDFGLEHVGLLGDAQDVEDVYIFDFSDYGRGPVVWELATVASRLYWEGDVSLRRWHELVSWLCDGYRAKSALAERDWAAFVPALIERLLVEVRYLNRVAFRSRSAFRPTGVEKRYALAEHVLTSGDCDTGRIESSTT
jgi:Ser/Thr protein kinase RdoA (MazF antagonist)